MTATIIQPGRYRVVIRRALGAPIRPEAEQLDGKVFTFRYGWTMDEDDPYPGELAMIPVDTNYPADAPAWIASGDMVEVSA